VNPSLDLTQRLRFASGMLIRARHCADFDAGIGSRRNRQDRRHGLEVLRLSGVMPPVPRDEDHPAGGAWILEHSSERQTGGAE